MQEDDQKAKVYRISYKDDNGKRDQEVFSASVEEAKNRREKFEQEHENYTEIKLRMLPSSPNTIFEALQK